MTINMSQANAIQRGSINWTGGEQEQWKKKKKNDESKVKKRGRHKSVDFSSFVRSNYHIVAYIGAFNTTNGSHIIANNNNNNNKNHDCDEVPCVDYNWPIPLSFPRYN